MRAGTVHIAVALFFAGLADYLFYNHVLGCNVTVFALPLAAVLAIRYRRRVGRALLIIALWLVVAVGASLQFSNIGFALVIVLGWAALAMRTLPRGASLPEAVVDGAAGGVAAFLAPAVAAIRARAARVRAAGGKAAPSWVVAVPAIILCTFAALIIPANLALTQWCREVVDTLRRWLADVSAARVALWIVVGAQVFGLLTFRARRLWRRKAAAPHVARPADAVREELIAAVLTFAGLNALYLAANTADAAYLWLALKLPAGLTYSEFAHQGSYRLVIAEVLAAAVITAFFRKGAPASAGRGARALGYVFLTQNLVVLVGAARRLQLYVEVYGLTRFRVAAFLWMLLVCAGFALILAKLLRNLPFSFLVRTNALAAAALLVAVSVMDLGAFISNWNVDRYFHGSRVAVDIEYLAQLGPSAMPALARLSADTDSDVAVQAHLALARNLAEARDRASHWQSATYRLVASIREASPLEAALPPLDASAIREQSGPSDDTYGS